MTTTGTIKSNCNNETCTISRDNGFSILISDKDGYVNALKLVYHINDKKSFTKELINIIQSPELKV